MLCLTFVALLLFGDALLSSVEAKGGGRGGGGGRSSGSRLKSSGFNYGSSYSVGGGGSSLAVPETSEQIREKEGRFAATVARAERKLAAERESQSVAAPPGTGGAVTCIAGCYGKR